MKPLISIILFLFVSGFSSETYAQNFGWKKLTEVESNEIEYLDTLNIDTIGNLIFFYIKWEYPDSDFRKTNINHEDSTYILYSANTEIQELNIISRISFYPNGITQVYPCKVRIGCDILKYGIFNIIYVYYYNMITGKSLTPCPE